MIGDWQPIETAPDNLIVLTVCANGTMWIASKHDGEWFLLQDEIGFEMEPTHWMLLPKPPTATAPDEER